MSNGNVNDTDLKYMTPQNNTVEHAVIRGQIEEENFNVYKKKNYKKFPHVYVYSYLYVISSTKLIKTSILLLMNFEKRKTIKVRCIKKQ